jgi:2',3'-cyclic-nucleotide 2'-phosphodiesterase (5'-nucleotidase family)
MNKTLLALSLAVGLLPLAQAKEITIFHTNDLHAHVSPFKAPYIDKNRLVGGFAHVATLVKEAKKNDRAVFYFDAGDYFTGPYISTLTDGEAIIDIMNEMSLDAASVGNHEFDYGVDNMVAQLKKARFPVLLGNIFYESNGRPVWNRPWTILEKDGVKIGVIGLHGRFAFYDTVNAARRKGVETRDEIQYLKTYLAEIRDKVDITVLLVHEGIPARQSSFGSADVARMLQKDIETATAAEGLGLDVLITGHAHVGTPEPIKVKDTLIVSTDALGINLGKLVIDYNEKTKKIDGYNGRLITIRADEIKPDPATNERIVAWNKKLETITGKVIGSTSSNITRAYGTSSPAGNLMTDAIHAKVPEADAVFTNSGGLRNDIPAGEITLGSIISMYPLINDISVMDITGKLLRNAMEHAAGLTNGVMQVSKGVVVEYDSKQPVGHRVTSFSINGAAVEDDKTYKVAVNSFVGSGGDGYAAFLSGTHVKTAPGTTVADAIIDYIKSKGSFAPSTEARVRDVSASK